MEPDKSREGLYLSAARGRVGTRTERAGGSIPYHCYEIADNLPPLVPRIMSSLAVNIQAVMGTTVVVFTAATIYIAVEGGAMLAERYLGAQAIPRRPRRGHRDWAQGRPRGGARRRA